MDILFGMPDVHIDTMYASLSFHAFVWLHPMFKWTCCKVRRVRGQFGLEPSFHFFLNLSTYWFYNVPAPMFEELVNVEGSWTLTSAKISQAIVVYSGMDSLHHSKNYARNGVARGVRTNKILKHPKIKSWNILEKTGSMWTTHIFIFEALQMSLQIQHPWTLKLIWISFKE